MHESNSSTLPLDPFYDLYTLIQTTFFGMPVAGNPKTSKVQREEATQSFDRFRQQAFSEFQRLQSLCFQTDKTCREDLRSVEDLFGFLCNWEPFKAKKVDIQKLIDLRNKASTAIYPWAFRPKPSDSRPLEVPILVNPVVAKCDLKTNRDKSDEREFTKAPKPRNREVKILSRPGGSTCEVTPGEFRAWHAVRLAKHLSSEMGNPLGEASIEEIFNFLIDHADHEKVKELLPTSLVAFKKSITRVYEKIGMPCPRPRVIRAKKTFKSGPQEDSEDK